MPLPPRNILLFHLGALGDFVLTWPLALALGRIHPQSRIIYVTHGQKGALAEKLLRVESADIEGGWHHLFGDSAKLPTKAAQLLANAHSIYSFIATPGDVWTATVAALAPQARIVHLQTRPPSDWSAHFTDHLLSQLASRPAVAEATRQLLGSIQDRGLRPRSKHGQTILIHPGSGSPTKCWPPDRFLELAGHIAQAGRDVRFILGEVEAEQWEANQSAEFAATAPIIRPADYVQLADTLANARLYIGNDSGPSHLAGVLGIPTLCIFGSTNPAIWRPLGPQVRIISGPALDAVSVDEVWELAREA